MKGWFGVSVVLISFLMLSGCLIKTTEINYISNSPEILLETDFQYGNSNGNIRNCGYILEMEESVFMADRYENILYKYEIKEKQLKKIAENCHGYLNRYNQELFYISDGGIVSLDLAGGEIEKYYGEWPGEFIVYGDNIYLTNDRIYQLSLKTKEIISLNTIGECANLNVGDNKIFYTSLDGVENDIPEQGLNDVWDYFGYIYQLELDTGENKKISEQMVTKLVFYDGYLYYIPFDNFFNSEGICRMNTETYEVEIITDVLYVDLNIDGDKLICSNYSSIDVLDLTGAEMKKITPEESFRDTYINVAHGSIFYRRFGTNRINMIDNITYEEATIIHDTERTE